MNIYLDDNLADKTLRTLLAKARHVFIKPADVKLEGKSDARHLQHAIENKLVILTSDRDDFRDLHYLILAAGGSHSGIMVVHFDNNPSRDMHPKQIVQAVGKLERSSVPLASELVILNHWR